MVRTVFGSLGSLEKFVWFVLKCIQIVILLLRGVFGVLCELGLLLCLPVCMRSDFFKRDRLYAAGPE